MSKFGENFKKAAQEFLGTTPEDKKLREEAVSRVKRSLETGDTAELTAEDRAEIEKLIAGFAEEAAHEKDVAADLAEGLGTEPVEPDDEVEGVEREADSGSELEFFKDLPREPEPEPAPMALEAPAEPTIIAAGTFITGNLEARGAVQLQGAIKGDLISRGNIKVSGKLAGTAQGFNIQILGGAVQGSIQADGDVEVDADSVVVGPIFGNNLMINGLVRGDLHATGSVSLLAKAKVKGDVTAAVISIREQAVLEGKLQVTSENLDDLFNIEL